MQLAFLPNMGEHNLIKELLRIGSEQHSFPEDLEFDVHKDIDRSYCDKVAAFSGPLKTFGILGIRKNKGMRPIKSWFAKKHCTSLLYINNEDNSM